MKATQSLNVAMSDMFRAIAGAPESQFDLIACTVYSAAYSIMQAGNKTQFSKLDADTKMYGVDSTEASKAAKDALGVKTLNSAVKHFKKVYFSIGVALAQMGVPSLVKDLPKGKAEMDAILAPLADAYALEFTSIFVATLTMPEKTEAERTEAAAASKVKREAKAKEAEKALKATIKEEALKLASAKELTIADMARMVADALRAGALDAETEASIIEAAQTRETAVLLAKVAVPELEAA